MQKFQMVSYYREWQEIIRWSPVNFGLNLKHIFNIGSVPTKVPKVPQLFGKTVYYLNLTGFLASQNFG
jgi:hypothetical protein